MSEQTHSVTSKVWGNVRATAGRWCILWQLPGAAHIPYYFENVRQVRKAPLQATE